MRTSTPHAPPLPAATRGDRSDPLAADGLPTARDLARDLVALLFTRAHAGARRLRGSARARPAAWRCAVAVLAIAVSSTWLSWVVWDSTVEHRDAGAGAAWSVREGDDVSLLDPDTTDDLELRRGAAPGEPQDPGSADATASQPVSNGAGGSPPSALGGWVVSLAAVMAVLAAGTGAAVLVVRSYRRRLAAPGEASAADVGAPPARDPAEPAPGEHADASDEVLDPTTADRSEWTGEPDRPAGAPRGADASEQVGPPHDLTASTRSSGRADVSSPREADGVVPMIGSTAVVVGELGPTRVEARQRLFERRGATRVDYVRDGALRWRGTQCTMTVQDLSSTGLRLRVTGTPAPVRPLPGTGDYVEVDFPVDGGDVRVAAQVAWRRTTPDGVEIGVVFRPLVDRDLELIRMTCLVRS